MAKSSNYKSDPIGQFEGWISTLNTPSDFVNLLPLFKKLEDHVFLREQLIYHRGDFSRFNFKILHIPGLQIEQVDSKAWLYSGIQISKMVREPIHGLFLIIPGKYPNIYRVVSVSKSAFWDQVIRKVIHRAYPEAMRVFLRQEEIREAFGALEKSLGDDHRIHILDATLKAKRDTDFRNRKGQFNTDRVWRDQSVIEMFIDATEKGQWFSSLKFSIQRRSQRSNKYINVATGKINKFGEIFQDYYFNQIEDGFISILESFAYERLELYQNRGIKEREYKPSPPLEIFYDVDLFDDIEEIRRFGKTMVQYPDSSIAIYHANPYYHASVADFSDGSSFEIWILSPTRILIAPQAKSSPQALERITSYIFDEFREGDIKEYGD